MSYLPYDLYHARVYLAQEEAKKFSSIEEAIDHHAKQAQIHMQIICGLHQIDLEKKEREACGR